MRDEDPEAPPRDPVSPESLSELASLVEHLADQPDLAAVSRVVVDFAVQQLGADVAGLARRPAGDAPQRLAATHVVLATDVDPAEGRLGGPWQDPPPERLVVVDDTRTDPRWLGWSSVLAEHDLRAVCGVVVTHLDEDPVTLELFSRRTGRFTDAEETGLVAAARILGAGVRHAHRALNLQQAMATRDLIAQAQGILMERHGLDGPQAMGYLRRVSQHSNRKVREIARDVVRGDEPPLLGG